MFKSAYTALVFIAISIIITCPATAFAAETPTKSIVKKFANEMDIVKPSSDAITITSNKNAFVKLEKDAHSVIVNNPERASVMLDTPRLLIIVPHKPGATSFTVLDSHGETVLQKDLIISNTQEKYVRIRRMCAANDRTCVADAYFYCPNGCYEVSPVAPASGKASAPALRPSETTTDTETENLSAAENSANAPVAAKPDTGEEPMPEDAPPEE